MYALFMLPEGSEKPESGTARIKRRKDILWRGVETTQSLAHLSYQILTPPPRVIGAEDERDSMKMSASDCSPKQNESDFRNYLLCVFPLPLLSINIENCGLVLL